MNVESQNTLFYLPAQHSSIIFVNGSCDEPKWKNINPYFHSFPNYIKKIQPGILQKINTRNNQYYSELSGNQIQAQVCEHIDFKKFFFQVNFVRTLGKTVWEKNFVKYFVVYHDHKLIILEMTHNNNFEGLIPPFYLDFSYFYPTQFQNFSNPLTCQMENISYCQFYPLWEQTVIPQEHSEPTFDKAYENPAIEQTSTGSRSQEFFEKVKRTQAPRFRPTKNNESNISNQAFSFVTNENKSKNILENFFKNKRKTEVFYEYSKCLNSKRKKYMSKGTLLKLCKLTQKSPELEQVLKSKNFAQITLSQFVSGVRFLILYFLRHKSTSSILTSQKIALNLKKDHINKVREIRMFIEENLLE